MAPASRTPMTPYMAANPAQIESSIHGGAPMTVFLIAPIPQDGGSSHDTGRIQPGNSAVGTRNPQASQTGYSRRPPRAQAARYLTTVTDKRKPRTANERTVTVTATMNNNGCAGSVSIPNARRAQSKVATMP